MSFLRFASHTRPEVVGDAEGCTVSNLKTLWELNDGFAHIYGDGGVAEARAQSFTVGAGCTIDDIQLRAVNYDLVEADNEQVFVDIYDDLDDYDPDEAATPAPYLARSQDKQAHLLPVDPGFSPGDTVSDDVPLTNFHFFVPYTSAGQQLFLVVRRYSTNDQTKKPSVRHWGHASQPFPGSMWTRNNGVWTEETAGGNTFDFEFVVSGS